MAVPEEEQEQEQESDCGLRWLCWKKKKKEAMGAALRTRETADSSKLGKELIFFFDFL